MSSGKLFATRNDATPFVMRARSIVNDCTANEDSVLKLSLSVPPAFFRFLQGDMTKSLAQLFGCSFRLSRRYFDSLMFVCNFC